MPRTPRSSSIIKHQAEKLRVEQTEPEALLWGRLRDRRLGGIKFRRQHAIGRYVVDFCAPEQKIVVELDGSQHIDRRAQDDERTTWLESLGYRVLRFWNGDVTNDVKAVLTSILQEARHA